MRDLQRHLDGKTKPKVAARELRPVVAERDIGHGNLGVGMPEQYRTKEGHLNLWLDEERHGVCCRRVSAMPKLR